MGITNQLDFGGKGIRDEGILGEGLGVGLGGLCEGLGGLG